MWYRIKKEKRETSVWFIVISFQFSVNVKKIKR